MKTSNLKLGELLLYSGRLTKGQLDKALKKQEITNKKIGEILVDEGYVTNKDIIEVLEFQLGIPHVDLDKFTIKQDIATQIPENIARRYDLIAIDKKKDLLVVAMADPLDIFAIDDIRMLTKHDIQPVISAREDILKTLINIIEKINGEGLKEFTESYRQEISMI